MCRAAPVPIQMSQRISLHMPSTEQPEMASALKSVNALIEKLNQTNLGSEDECSSVASGPTWVTDSESTASSAARWSNERRVRRIVWPDGTFFQGTLRKGTRRPDGIGELRAANGDSYKGEWENGAISGYGIYKLAAGGQYEGRVKNNQRHGYGRLSCWNGVGYEGTWADDKPDGFGTMTAADGTVQYSGQWQRGKAHGHGTFTSANWGTYVGGWKNDRKDGQGRVEYATGAVYDGGWVDDQAHGFARYEWPNGNNYEGMFDHGKMCGQGRYAVAGQTQYYTGSWKNNMKNGYGEMQFADGAVYRGQWENDRPDGEGVFINPYGVIFRGVWHGGCFDPEASGEDPRGRQVCLVEYSSHELTDNSAENKTKIQDRLVFPAPDPGAPEMRAAMPLPRKFKETEELESEVSPIFLSPMHPVQNPVADTGYVYKTQYAIDYYPRGPGKRQISATGQELLDAGSRTEVEIQAPSGATDAETGGLVVTAIPSGVAVSVPTEEIQTSIVEETRLWLSPVPGRDDDPQDISNLVSQIPIQMSTSPQQFIYPTVVNEQAHLPPAPSPQQQVVVIYPPQLQVVPEQPLQPLQTQPEPQVLTQPQTVADHQPPVFSQSETGLTLLRTQSLTHPPSRHLDSRIPSCAEVAPESVMAGPQRRCSHMYTSATPAPATIPLSTQIDPDVVQQQQSAYQFRQISRQPASHPVTPQSISQRQLGSTVMGAAAPPIYGTSYRSSFPSAFIPASHEVIYNSRTSLPARSPPGDQLFIPPPVKPPVILPACHREDMQFANASTTGPNDARATWRKMDTMLASSAPRTAPAAISPAGSTPTARETSKATMIAVEKDFDPMNAIIYAGHPISAIAEESHTERTVTATTLSAEVGPTLQETPHEENSVVAVEQPPFYTEEVKIPRRVPIPVEARTTIELRLPQIRTARTRIEYPVYAPRFIEIPVPLETLSPEGLQLCESLNQQLAILQNLPNISACELDMLAGDIIAALRTAEDIEGSHRRPLAPQDLSTFMGVVDVKGAGLLGNENKEFGQPPPEA